MQSESRYLPATQAEIKRILDVIGYESVDALLRDLVPADHLLDKPLSLPKGLSEIELVKKLESLASKNVIATERSFLGGGAYRHVIPSSIKHLAGRGEFLTAYTPYQPEVSQGTLQAIFEFQTMIAEIFGMDVANASMYDGASSLAEAVFTANRVSRGKKPKVLMLGNIHPEYLEVVNTYNSAGIVDIKHLSAGPDGRIDFDSLENMLDGKVCALVVQSPNFFGIVEDLARVSEFAQKAKALMIVAVTDPHAYAILESPGKLGADIVVGEGQPLGIPVSFGGPYLGLFAIKEQYLRQMPGRVVGKTLDLDGKDGFVLTLSTREQHIKRAKATSNICTNQGLCALQTSIYLSLMGPVGLKEVAIQSLSKARYLSSILDDIPGFEVLYKNAPSFHEFVLKTPVDAEGLVEELALEGIFAGVPLSRYGGDRNQLLVCVTEINTKAAMDELANKLREKA